VTQAYSSNVLNKIQVTQDHQYKIWIAQGTLGYAEGNIFEDFELISKEETKKIHGSQDTSSRVIGGIGVINQVLDGDEMAAIVFEYTHLTNDLEQSERYESYIRDVLFWRNSK
jgi:hypothetical protein